MAQTIQDVFDSMSETKKDAAALLLGAIAEGDEAVGGNVLVTPSETLLDVFESMTSLERDVIDFLAAEVRSDVEHADEEFMEDFLAHFGVKGMRWGIRRDRSAPSVQNRASLSKSAKNSKEQRREARINVKRNSASLGEAHIAGLKSTGHRVANAVFGDKTFWKRTVGIVLGAGVAAGVSTFVPGMLPSDILQKVGMEALSNSDAGLKEGVVKVGDYTLASKANAENAGKMALQTIGLSATAVAAGVASSANEVSNLVRAVRGNARINKSYEQLGKHMAAHQSQGNKKVNKILKRNGSIKIKHADEEFVGNFLSHFGLERDEDPKVDGEGLLEHFGIKGMKWGIRRKVTSDGTVDTSDPGQPSGKSMSDDTEAQRSADYDRAAKAYAKSQEKGLQALSNDEINAIKKRVDAEKSFHQLTADQNKELQMQVDRLQLEKQYRQLKSEASLAKRTTGRKILDALLKGAVDTASDHAQAQGKKMITDMLASSGSKGAAKAAVKSVSKNAPFKVNPSKVTVSRPPSGVAVR